jgi:hypothetical protein
VDIVELVLIHPGQPRAAGDGPLAAAVSLSWCLFARLLCSEQNPLAVLGLAQECSRQLGFLVAGVFLRLLLIQKLILYPGVSEGPQELRSRQRIRPPR